MNKLKIKQNAFIGNTDELERTIEDALDYINWKHHVKSDMHVFVKPNFTFPAYKEGVTTAVLHK